MSIEDEAKKELERRNKEKTEQEALQSAKLEKRISSLYALLNSLELEDAFEEIRDKYWGIGTIHQILQDDILWIELIHRYENIFYDFDPDGDLRSATVKDTFLFSLRIGLKWEYEPRNVTVYINQTHRGPQASFKVNDKGNFESTDQVSMWIKKHLSDLVIELTKGDLTRRNIIKTRLKEVQKEVSDFKKEREVKRIAYEKGIKQQEPKGCWPFS